MEKSVFLLLLLLLVAPALAAVHYVSPSGNDVNSGSSLDPWRTINHSIDQSSPGDTVVMASGVYSDDIVSITKSIKLIGDYVNEKYAIINGVLTGDGVYKDWRNVYISYLNITGGTHTPVGFQTGMMFQMATGYTLYNVTFDHVAFWLNGNLPNTVRGTLISMAKPQIVDDSTNPGLTFQGCSFYTGSWENYGGSVFGIHVAGGPLTFDGVWVSGYDPTANQSAQVNTASPVDLTIKNSQTIGGGNFYVCAVDGYSIFDNDFVNAAIGIDGCRNGIVRNNRFVDTGTHPVYAPPHYPDPYEHAGGIGLLSMDGFSTGITGLSFEDNHFSGKLVNSAILINRWKVPPTEDQFQNVIFRRNDFSEIQATGSGSFIIESKFSSAKIDASRNYWGGGAPGDRIQGTIITEPYYTDPGMSNLDTTDGGSSDGKSTNWWAIVLGVIVGVVMISIVPLAVIGVVIIVALGFVSFLATRKSMKSSINKGSREYGAAGWSSVAKDEKAAESRDVQIDDVFSAPVAEPE